MDSQLSFDEDLAVLRRPRRRADLRVDVHLQRPTKLRVANVLQAEM